MMLAVLLLLGADASTRTLSFGEVARLRCGASSSADTLDSVARGLKEKADAAQRAGDFAAALTGYGRALDAIADNASVRLLSLTLTFFRTHSSPPVVASTPPAATRSSATTTKLSKAAML